MKVTGKTNEQLMFKRLNKWQAGEIERLREALKDLREAAAHVLANEPRDGIVGGPWLRSAYRDSEEVERVLGRRTHE